MNQIPRIRGRVGQIEDPADLKGKWAFEVSVWTFDGEKQIGEPINVAPFDTEETAHVAMKEAVREVCEQYEKLHGVMVPTGKYLDMKNGGIVRPWDEQ